MYISEALLSSASLSASGEKQEPLESWKKKSPCNEEFHALKKSLCWLNEGRKVAGLDLDNDTPDINKGRFALASSQEDINISKLLWKEYLRD